MMNRILGWLAAPLPKGTAKATRVVQIKGNRFFMPSILRNPPDGAIPNPGKSAFIRIPGQPVLLNPATDSIEPLWESRSPHGGTREKHEEHPRSTRGAPEEHTRNTRGSLLTLWLAPRLHLALLTYSSGCRSAGDEARSREATGRHCASNILSGAVWCSSIAWRRRQELRDPLFHQAGASLKGPAADGRSDRNWW